MLGHSPLTLRAPWSDRWNFSHPRAQPSFSHNWYCCQIRLVWRLIMIKASCAVQLGRKGTEMRTERHKTREHRWEWENSNQWWKPCLEKNSLSLKMSTAEKSPVPTARWWTSSWECLCMVNLDLDIGKTDTKDTEDYWWWVSSSVSLSGTSGRLSSSASCEETTGWLLSRRLSVSKGRGAISKMARRGQHSGSYRRIWLFGEARGNSKAMGISDPERKGLAFSGTWAHNRFLVSIARWHCMAPVVSRPKTGAIYCLYNCLPPATPISSQNVYCFPFLSFCYECLALYICLIHNTYIKRHMHVYISHSWICFWQCLFWNFQLILSCH